MRVGREGEREREMQLLKFASNAVNRTPLPENGFRICACKTTTTYAATGNEGGKGWQRGCECTERRRAAGPMVVVPCINHPSARHSHSQAPKPTPRVARASVVLDHPFCVSCAIHIRPHMYIHPPHIVPQTQIHTPEAHKPRAE